MQTKAGLLPKCFIEFIMGTRRKRILRFYKTYRMFRGRTEGAAGGFKVDQGGTGMGKQREKGIKRASGV